MQKLRTQVTSNYSSSSIFYLIICVAQTYPVYAAKKIDDRDFLRTKPGCVSVALQKDGLVETTTCMSVFFAALLPRVGTSS